MDTLEILENSPARQSYIAAKIMEKRKHLREVEHKLRIEEAKSTIKHSNAKNASLLKALVTTEPSIIAAEKIVLMARSELECEEIAFNKEANEYRSAHKIAKMDEYERKAWSGQSVVPDNI